MFELLYTSFSPKGLSDSELTNILEAARLKNEELSVTGMMIYHNGEIMQLLEGEKKTVESLYNTICQDKRHRSVYVLYQGEIESRSFSSWSMAFKSLDKEMIESITAGYENLDQDKSPIGMIKESLNPGKKAFLILRDSFLN